MDIDLTKLKAGSRIGALCAILGDGVQLDCLVSEAMTAVPRALARP